MRFAELLEAVCHEYDLEPLEVLGVGREGRRPEARAVIARILHDDGRSWAEIARVLRMARGGSLVRAANRIPADRLETIYKTLGRTTDYKRVGYVPGATAANQTSGG